MGNSEIKENILFQLEMCWQLYLYHTENLQEEEAHWSFTTTGLKVRKKDEEYQSQQYAKWPLKDRSFADTALWLNGELMKNVAEIGYGRFLYAACKK